LDEHVSESVVELSEGMNERLAKVTESVDRRFKSVASEIKQSRQELSKDTEVNAKELSTFKEVVAGINQSNLSKINELSSRVINLQDKVSAISCCRSSKSTADSQMAGHSNSVRSTTAEVRMPAYVNECIEFTSTDDVGISACLSEGSGAMPVCINRNMQCSNNGAVNQAELSNENGMQWNSNLISDLRLPKFTDAAKQNAVQFLTELNS
jgi:cell division protein ZapA (FtsZ GTPase activity inhibitor)